MTALLGSQPGARAARLPILALLLGNWAAEHWLLSRFQRSTTSIACMPPIVKKQHCCLRTSIIFVEVSLRRRGFLKKQEHRRVGGDPMCWQEGFWHALTLCHAVVQPSGGGQHRRGICPAAAAHLAVTLSSCPARLGRVSLGSQYIICAPCGA